jgi:hypothetical protein
VGDEKTAISGTRLWMKLATLRCLRAWCREVGNVNNKGGEQGGTRASGRGWRVDVWRQAVDEVVVYESRGRIVKLDVFGVCLRNRKIERMRMLGMKMRNNRQARQGSSRQAGARESGERVVLACNEDTSAVT